MNKPCVSILIPVYNRQDLVAECIASALSQTFNDLEVVVVDNASTDRTWEVCQTLAEGEPRLRVFRNEENVGPVRNWRRCIELARGRYGKLLFSDDLIDPDYLAKVLPLLEEDPGVGFAFTAVRIGEDQETASICFHFTGKSGIFRSSHYLEAALSGGDVPFSPGCALFRMELLQGNLKEQIPSPSITDFVDHGAGPDLLLFLLGAAASERVGYIHEPLTFFRAHQGSISISTRHRYLLSCYRQARIWFAQNYLNRCSFARMCTWEWRRECREGGQWKRPRAVLEQYGVDLSGISMFDVLWSCLFHTPRRINVKVKI